MNTTRAIYTTAGAGSDWWALGVPSVLQLVKSDGRTLHVPSVLQRVQAPIDDHYTFRLY